MSRGTSPTLIPSATRVSSRRARKLPQHEVLYCCALIGVESAGHDQRRAVGNHRNGRSNPGCDGAQEMCGDGHCATRDARQCQRAHQSDIEDATWSERDAASYDKRFTSHRGNAQTQPAVAKVSLKPGHEERIEYQAHQDAQALHDAPCSVLARRHDGRAERHAEVD